MLALQVPWIADPLAFCQSSIAASSAFRGAPSGRLDFERPHHPKGVHHPDRKGFSGELEML
nr:hypothetical protein [Methylobacterium sp. ZNC0032]